MFINPALTETSQLSSAVCLQHGAGRDHVWPVLDPEGSHIPQGGLFHLVESTAVISQIVGVWIYFIRWDMSFVLKSLIFSSSIAIAGCRTILSHEITTEHHQGTMSIFSIQYTTNNGSRYCISMDNCFSKPMLKEQRIIWPQRYNVIT